MLPSVKLHCLQLHETFYLKYLKLGYLIWLKANLKDRGSWFQGSRPIILITDPFKENDHAELQKELLGLDSVKAIRSIRIEAE